MQQLESIELFMQRLYLEDFYLKNEERLWRSEYKAIVDKIGYSSQLLINAAELVK